MHMKLTNPLEVRQRMAEKNLLTHEEIAERLAMSNRTVGRLLAGRKIRFGTVRRLAEFLETEPSAIAELTEA